MTAPALSIRRLATRVAVPDAGAAISAARLVDAARDPLARALDAALPRLLDELGLDPATVIALPRVVLRLRLEGEVDAAALGRAWAAAVVDALKEALPTAARPPAAAAARPATPSVIEAWAAETAVLRALATGAPLPWWAEEVLGTVERAGAARHLIATWLDRDPARAAHVLAALLVEVPAVARLLTSAEAGRLAEALLARAVRSLTCAGASAAVPAPLAASAATVPAVVGALPEPLAARLAALEAEARPLWIGAAVLARAPQWAASLPSLLPTLTTLPRTAWRVAGTPPPLPTPLTKVRQGQALPKDASPPRRPPAAAAASVQVVEVWGGGLLLLFQPIARLLAPWLDDGAHLRERLLALGLVALQPLAGPLPAAARRAVLERDRPLLEVFTGGPLDESPIERQVAHPQHQAEAAAALARILAAAPAGIVHAPGALRRTYGGRDPFAPDARTSLICRLVLRPGRLRLDDAAAELTWPLDAADPALRRAGWDLDPGWLPWLGRRITFCYGERSGA